MNSLDTFTQSFALYDYYSPRETCFVPVRICQPGKGYTEGVCGYDIGGAGGDRGASSAGQPNLRKESLRGAGLGEQPGMRQNDQFPLPPSQGRACACAPAHASPSTICIHVR